MMREELTAPRDISAAEAIIATNLLGPIRLIDALIGHLPANSNRLSST